MADVFAAIDLTTVVAALTPIIIAGIGIRMAFKGGQIGKQAVRSA